MKMKKKKTFWGRSHLNLLLELGLKLWQANRHLAHLVLESRDTSSSLRGLF